LSYPVSTDECQVKHILIGRRRANNNTNTLSTLEAESEPSEY